MLIHHPQVGCIPLKNTYTTKHFKLGCQSHIVIQGIAMVHRPKIKATLLNIFQINKHYIRAGIRFNVYDFGGVDNVSM